MKYLKLLLVLFVMPLLSLYGQTIAFDSISSWNQIMEKAKKENKYIFIDAYTTWCAVCKKMDRDVFTDKDLIRFINDKFIPVKLQIDSTFKDGEYIRKRYRDAAKIQSQYKINAFPSFIFLTPSGELADRSIGFQPPSVFLQVATRALDDNNNFAATLSKFRTGSFTGKELLLFCLNTKKYYKEDSIALIAAQEYKKHHIDNNEPSEILDSVVIDFMYAFYSLFTLEDPVIQYIYNTPVQFNSLRIGANAQGYIDALVKKDLVIPKVYEINDNDYLPNAKEPNWKKLEKTVAQKLDKETAIRTILDTKTIYYAIKKDWTKAAQAEIDRIEWKGLNANDGWVRFSMNNMIWEVFFEHSNNPRHLKKAINYMQKIVEADSSNAGFRDTYANLLYKAGRKTEAIIEQEIAVTQILTSNEKDRIENFKQTLIKMRNGDPTWPKN